MVCVSILIYGNEFYIRAGRESVLSVLENSPFDIHVTGSEGIASRLPRNERIVVHPLPHMPPIRHRSRRFLLKFEALKQCLSGCDHEYVIMLDGDAVFATEIETGQIKTELGLHEIGMVEQSTIIGSGMTRQDFYKHYLEYSLAFLGPDEEPPSIENFRYFNSGFVLGRRSEMEKIASWALSRMDSAVTGEKEHQVGIHMIADQDYLQYWVHNVNPGSCMHLPWYWNHCRHWDEGFPRPEARVVHFSNFCNGPNKDIIRQMQEFRRPKKRYFFLSDVPRSIAARLLTHRS
jgi:hypothetical protein